MEARQHKITTQAKENHRILFPINEVVRYID